MHTRAKLGVVALGAVTTMVAAPAFAQVTQEEGGRFLDRPVAAPRDALELTIAPEYSQPFGNIERDVSLRDTAGPGGGVHGGLAYRIDPHWSVGLTGSYAAYGTGEARATPSVPGTANAVTGALEGVFHVFPYHPVDPFFSLGTGWRGMWERHDAPATDTFRHGLSVVRVGLGIDIRLSPDLAIAPVVAGDANIFLWENPEGAGVNSKIVDPRVNFFLSAGMQGRFDLGGDRVDQEAATSVTTTTSAPLRQEVPR
jgi:hypothetical protein